MAPVAVKFLDCQRLLECSFRLIIQAIHITLLCLLRWPRLTTTEQLAPRLLGPGPVALHEEVDIVSYILLFFLSQPFILLLFSSVD